MAPAAKTEPKATNDIRKPPAMAECDLRYSVALSSSVLRRWLFLVLLAGLAPSAALRAQSNYSTPFTFTTLAGTPSNAGSADGASSAAQFENPNGVAVDSEGNVYVADLGNNTIRKITPGGVVTTLAGTPGVSGSADGTGGAAQFAKPSGVAVDSLGNVYVADSFNNTIRKISSGGAVTTLAGTPGIVGSADGSGGAAQFNRPGGVAVDGTGNVYVADSLNRTIRKITSNGVVTTLAGTPGILGALDGPGSIARFANPTGVAVDGEGNVYVADNYNFTIRKITSAGLVTTLAGSLSSMGSADGIGTNAQFNYPQGVAVDNAGNVYVTDTNNNAIRMITPAGVVTTLAGSANANGAFSNGRGSVVRFDLPAQLAVDSVGNIYVGDSGNQVVRWGALIVPTLNSVSTASGVYGQTFSYSAMFSGALNDFGASGLPAGLSINSATGVIFGTVSATKGSYSVTLTAINGAGAGSGTLNLVVAAPSGASAYPNAPTAIAVLLGTGQATVSFTPPSYTGGTAITGYSVTATPTSGSPVTATGTSSPITVTGLSNATVYTFTVAATNGAGTGATSAPESPNTLPIFTTQPVGQSVNLGATVTFSASATGVPSPTYQWQLNGANVTGATSSSLTISNAQIAEGGSYTVLATNASGSVMSNPAILSVTVPITYTTSIYATLPAGGTGPNGIAVDGAENVYVAAGNAVERVTSTGAVFLVAGSLTASGSADGAGAAALFNHPTGLATDSSGNIYVADSGNNSIRRITPLGIVTTLAGLVQGNADGVGVAAKFNDPTAVAVDSAGNVYVADTGNNELREISPNGTTTTLLVGSSLNYSIAGVALDAVGNVYAGVKVNIPQGSVTVTGAYVWKITGGGSYTQLFADSNYAYPGAIGDAKIAISGNTGFFVLSGNSLYQGAIAISVAKDNPTYSFAAAIATDANGRIFEAYPPNNSIVVVAPVGSVPNIAVQPVGGTIAFGAGTTLAVAASGTPAPTYQWQVDGANIVGATSSSYVTSSPGTYTVLVSNSAGTVTSKPAVLTVANRLVNISSRAFVGTNANLEIAGFIVTGPPGTTEQVLVRGVGPTLTQYGVGGVLAQPVLTLFDSSGNQIASNTGWNTAQNAAQIASVTATTGAFALPLDSADSALLVRLPPGAYTAEVTGLNNATGVALAEVYEVQNGDPELINISTRAFVNTGSGVAIAGFVIGGSQPAKVLIRGVGPALASFGVSGILAQPSLSVVNSSGNVIAQNTGWATNANAATIASEAQAAGAFSLPSGSADCALLLTLAPGSYTAIVSGVNGSTGVALVEVYQAP
jgi:sugar lactone lactonase YvrE